MQTVSFLLFHCEVELVMPIPGTEHSHHIFLLSHMMPASSKSEIILIFSDFKQWWISSTNTDHWLLLKNKKL